MFTVGAIVFLILYLFFTVPFLVLIAMDGTVWLIFFLVLHFTFEEIVKREKKITDTSKELFSSYQYIGNVNRQIDILTNLNNYISKANFTVNEIAEFVVKTSGHLAEADFCTVFYYNKNQDHWIKSKIYYCPEKSKLNYFISRLKCDTCTSPMSDNNKMLIVDSKSAIRCKKFPESFWEKYQMISVPFVFKGEQKGFISIILNKNIEVSHTNLKMISSLATQLGTAMN